jgi:hypothetical protein
MINLDASTKSIEILLAGAITTSQLPITASYIDINASLEATAMPEADTQTNGATAVTAVAGPSSGSRKVSDISVFNADTVAATVTVRLNNNGTFRILCKVTLAVGDSLHYGG